ncbi:unnamed protein product [Amoebophrya sp. A25]|nr:unnamed protein product [Amoebophrya sp. A25]|eukprot:GSA25T00022305001.1
MPASSRVTRLLLALSPSAVQAALLAPFLQNNNVELRDAKRWKDFSTCPSATEHIMDDDSSTYCRIALEECQCREEELKAKKQELCGPFVRDLSLVTKDAGTCIGKVQLATERKQDCVRANQDAEKLHRKQMVEDVMKERGLSLVSEDGVVAGEVGINKVNGIETDATEFEGLCIDVDFEERCGLARGESETSEKTDMYKALCTPGHCGRRIGFLFKEIERIESALELYRIVDESAMKYGTC